MDQIESLKLELEECQKQKLFYYNNWKKEVQKNIEIEELLVEGSLVYTNPPLYAKIYKLLYNEDYNFNLDESAAE